MNQYLSRVRRARRAAGLVGLALLITVGAACSGDDSTDSSPTTAPSTTLAGPDTTGPDSTGPDGSGPVDSTAPAESVAPTSEPTPTLAPAIPEEELPDRLLEVFTDNFGDANFAFCVQQQVLTGLDDGKIAPVDIDNYVRNLVTDPMRALLIEIQDEATCS